MFQTGECLLQRTRSDRRSDGLRSTGEPRSMGLSVEWTWSKKVKRSDCIMGQLGEASKLRRYKLTRNHGKERTTQTKHAQKHTKCMVPLYQMNNYAH